MSDYRWNVGDYAAAFDAAAQHIHPWYLDIQQKLLDLIAEHAPQPKLLVDLGGGSGRFALLALERFEHLRVVVVDQSAAFLKLARERLSPLGARAECIEARLQDPWATKLSGPASVITSMSAIHHLDSREKQTLYEQCWGALGTGGLLANGDEVRPAGDADYLGQLKAWAAHKQRIVEAGLVSDAARELLAKWERRNIDQFSKPRASGDDCHDTTDDQLEMLRRAGFSKADVPWQRDMWAVLRGIK